MAARLRYLMLGVLGATTVLALVLAHAANWTLQAVGAANPALFGLRELQLGTALGYALAASAAGLVLLREGPRTWTSEVVDELLRVSWPSRDETVRATLVVMVCVVVCATFLGVFDAAWLWVSGKLMGSAATAG